MDSAAIWSGLLLRNPLTTSYLNLRLVVIIRVTNTYS